MTSMQQVINGRWSLRALWCICILVVGIRASMPQREVLTWDVFGYYLYLPATVIHQDLALRDATWLDEVMRTYMPSSTYYQLVDGPHGGRVIKYSSGMALLYAPFFFAAHLLAEPLGFPADGFSAPYQIAITIGCLAFALLGLVLLRNVLLHFFDDRWTTVLLLLIGVGTNWFQLTAWDGTLLTHSALFTLYAWLLLATIRWHASPSWRSAFGIGASLGLITLIRPSELVAVLIPLLWAIHDAAARKAKWHAVQKNIIHIVGAVVLSLIAISPQLVYWKLTTGNWIFYSYVNPGEGFDLATPYLRPFLISFRKGWFVYTPLMLLAMAGFATLWKRMPQAFWAVLTFLLVDLWIVSSWSCWWYAGGSFSARSMVPAYVLLALPLGTVLHRAWEKMPLRIPLITLCSACVVLNLFQTWQWTQGIISKERMTRAYYAAVFARTSVPPGAEDLLLVERPVTSEERLLRPERYVARTLFHWSFPDQPDSALALTPGTPYSPGPDVTFAQLTGKDHAWVRTTVSLWVGDTVVPPPTIVMTFHHNGEPYKYATSTWSIPGGTRQAWVSTSMDYLTPEVRSSEDNLKVYVWNQHNGHHHIRDLRVQIFEPH